MEKSTNFKLCNMRITGIDKNYYLNQFQIFTDYVISNRPDVKYVQFGKQDTRGGFSICLFDENHRVPKQEFFDSKDQMIGYICGVNDVINNYRHLIK